MMTAAERHQARERHVAGLIEQIARDVATLKLPPDMIAPSRAFYEERIAAYRATVLAIRCTDSPECAAAGCTECRQSYGGARWSAPSCARRLPSIDRINSSTAT